MLSSSSVLRDLPLDLEAVFHYGPVIGRAEEATARTEPVADTAERGKESLRLGGVI